MLVTYYPVHGRIAVPQRLYAILGHMHFGILQHINIPILINCLKRPLQRVGLQIIIAVNKCYIITLRSIKPGITRTVDAAVRLMHHPHTAVAGGIFIAYCTTAVG